MEKENWKGHFGGFQTPVYRLKLVQDEIFINLWQNMSNKDNVVKFEIKIKF